MSAHLNKDLHSKYHVSQQYNFLGWCRGMGEPKGSERVLRRRRSQLSWRGEGRVYRLSGVSRGLSERMDGTDGRGFLLNRLAESLVPNAGQEHADPQGR